MVLLSNSSWCLLGVLNRWTLIFLTTTLRDVSSLLHLGVCLLDWLGFLCLLICLGQSFFNLLLLSCFILDLSLLAGLLLLHLPVRALCVAINREEQVLLAQFTFHRLDPLRNILQQHDHVLLECFMVSRVCWIEWFQQDWL